MDLRQLSYLVALEDEGSFTGAAASVHVSQPSLSQQISRLEAELGLALVDRTTRRATLTQAGRLLTAHARRAIDEVDLARAELADLVGIQAGRLTIGASQTVGSLDLSGLLARFHHRYPGVELAVREELSIDLVAALRQDQLDLGFITTSGATELEGLELEVVAEEPLVAILPIGHRLATRKRLEVPDLRDEQLVGLRRGATIRRRLTEAAARAGFTPRIVFETNDVARIRSLVAEGLGMAIVPRSDAERPGAEVAIVPVRDPGFVHIVYLARRLGRHHSPAARAFIAQVLD